MTNKLDTENSSRLPLALSFVLFAGMRHFTVPSPRLRLAQMTGKGPGFQTGPRSRQTGCDSHAKPWEALLALPAKTSEHSDSIDTSAKLPDQSNTPVKRRLGLDNVEPEICASRRSLNFRLRSWGGA